MTRHDDLLQQGPREAPEPETAEQRSRRVGVGTAAGGAAAAGAAAIKFGGATKLLLWFFAWHGVVDAWRLGGWIAAAILFAAIAAFLVLRARGEA